MLKEWTDAFIAWLPAFILCFLGILLVISTKKERQEKQKDKQK